MNKWILTGRLTKDPEVSETPKGSIIVTVFLAIKREYKNKESGEYEADFFRLKAFAHSANYIHAYIKKGDLVEIDSSWQSSRWEKDGETKYGQEAIIKTISKISSPDKRKSAEVVGLETGGINV